jgi:CubicO group peptidase (beta-lactamase class C family)
MPFLLLASARTVAFEIVRLGWTALILAGVCVTAVAQPAAGSRDRATSFDRALTQASRIESLHSLLVSQGGELLVERYFNGASATRPANIKSVSKSVISALVGIAIDRGTIPGLDATLGTFFADELADDPEAAKADITIEDLLTMRAGLETTSNRNYGAWVVSSNWVEFALRQPLEFEPGRLRAYSTGNTHLLSAILTRAAQRSTLAFARDALAEPLGFQLPPWPRDPQGIYFGGNDMEMTPRQMLAFGELYLNGGRRGDRQVVPEQWVEASLVPRTESRRERGRYYGYGWWIRDMAGVQTPYAWGFGGQFIVLAPSLGLVVVTTADSMPRRNRRSQRRAIFDLIEREVVAPAAAPRTR